MPLMGRRGNMGGGGYGGGYNAGRMQGGGNNAYSSQPDNYGGQNDAYGGNYQSFSDNVMYPNVPSAGGNFYNM